MNHCMLCEKPYVHARIDQLLKPEVIKQITFGDRSTCICTDCVVGFLRRPLTDDDYLQTRTVPWHFCKLPPSAPTPIKLVDYIRVKSEWPKRRSKAIVMGVAMRQFPPPLTIDGEWIAQGYCQGDHAIPSIVLLSRYPHVAPPLPIVAPGYIKDFNAAMSIAVRLLNAGIREWMDKNVQIRRWCDICKDYTITETGCETDHNANHLSSIPS